jgi:hypothetical protein
MLLNMPTNATNAQKSQQAAASKNNGLNPLKPQPAPKQPPPSTNQYTNPLQGKHS